MFSARLVATLKTMYRLLLLPVTILLALLLVAFKPYPASPCQDGCHKQKSRAYQQCRTVPPTDRAARGACFRKADAALQRCLKSCK